MGSAYDDARIAAITEDVAQAIEQASYGNVPWITAAERLTAAFPGGFAAIVNQDFVNDEIRFFEWVNIDDGFARSYAEHYAHINPWANVFTAMPSGSVCVVEKHLPARTFEKSEFYNDWLSPQREVDAGCGLTVEASPTDLLYFPVHYPLRFAAQYDHAAAEVSRRLAGAIKRAINTSQHFLRGMEDVASGAAVSARRWPALVVDGNMRLCNANADGARFLAEGTLVNCTKGVVSFGDPALSRNVSKAVAGLAASAAASATTCASRDHLSPLVVELARLPRTHRLFKPLVRERMQILLQLKQLSAAPAPPELSAFADLFRLTPGELRLCAALYAGLSLQETALELGVTYETVRGRMKIVFQKTGTNTQAGLATLLGRYAL